MSQILIIDDEEIIRTAAGRLLERHGYTAVLAASVVEAEQNYSPSSFDLIIADLRLAVGKGTDVIPLCEGVPVLIMTSYTSVDSAVESMKRGAADYISKPFDHDEMVLVVERLIKEEYRRRQIEALRRDIDHHYPVSGMVGSCHAMLEIKSQISRVAPSESSVLVFGESGTGKELVARAIHQQSGRRDSPIVPVNCAAIPDTLMESELFGHQKGAFTGAVESRAGLIGAADGGTLFLDEIAELSPAAQAGMLRVLQDGEVRSLGSAMSHKVDVRVVAATHQDLEARVAEGRFREDLYYRIQVIEMRLPPLRERGDDAVELAHFLIKKVCGETNHPELSLTPEALEAISSYDWPGNIRELENAIERAVILAGDQRSIGCDLLSLGAGRRPAEGAQGGESLDDYLVRFVRENQRKMTETKMASQLGISRKTLWEKRQKLGIPRDRE